MELGYAISSEEHGPLDLVAQRRPGGGSGVRRSRLISDHFHPWIDRQGQSPFVWSVLGGIAARRTSSVGTGVTCPTIRIHPAIIAQAAATTAAMLPGRFFLGVGTGENLNEHVLGERWPPTAVRREMLEEAVEVMRELWRRRAHEPPRPPLHRRERPALHAAGRADRGHGGRRRHRGRQSSPGGSATG